MAYLILDTQYYDRLIPYEKYNEHVRETGQYPMAIPKVETWSDEKVPIKWLEKVILTKAQIQRVQVLEQAHQNLPWDQDSR